MSSRFDSDIEKVKAAVDRYHKSKNIQELNEAVKAWERILRDTGFAGTDTEFRLNVLNDSAETYFFRYEANFGDLNDLNRLIILREKAVDIAKAAHSPQLHIYLNNLGDSLMCRYNSDRTRHTSDLKRAVKGYEEAVDICGKNDLNSPELPLYIEKLKNARKLLNGLNKPKKSEPFLHYC